MSTPLILRDGPFTEPTEITIPDDITTVTEFSEAATMADLPSIFDAAFAILAQAGPVGPGYAIYAGDPNGVFDLEIGFPVAAVPAGYTANTFPAGSALALSHRGGYEGMQGSWEHLMSTFAERELGQIRLIGEIYVTDPSVTDAADMRTDLLVLY